MMCGCTNRTHEVKEHAEKVFNLLEPKNSHLNFENHLTHDVKTRFNLFDFDYFYNGAGVGVGDFNNDGLPDVFFCGSQVDNRLFLNLGGLTFRDITPGSGVNTHKRWANGVTLVDINKDGWLDIYVSQGGPYDEEDRANLLLVNQGNLTFKEEAKKYGLADTGLSTQSAFFDFDKDGDLDCIVMNENLLYGVFPTEFYRLLRTRKGLLYKSSTHFYINEDDQFKDATAQVGILRPSFGLGLVVSDINEDGWLDIYMANDYFIPDAMFINQKNGTFFDESKRRMKQVSFYGMGANIGDINNDLHQDIFVLDMASADHYRAKTLMASMSTDNFNLLVNKFDFIPQFMFNSLQLNQSDNTFSNIAQQLDMAKTDWSWTPLMVDFDNDGFKDVFVTNGFRRYAMDNDFKMKVMAAKRTYQGNVPLDVKNDLYNQMPSEKLPNVLFKNMGNLTFSNRAEEWGLATPSFSNGAACADLDLDGDVDLVVNNVDQPAFLYQNMTHEKGEGNYLRVKTSSDQKSDFSRVYISYGNNHQMFEVKGVRGYFSYSEPIAHFGLGSYDKVDTLTVIWPDGRRYQQFNVKANQLVKVTEADGRETSELVRKAPVNTFMNSIKPESIGLSFKHNENDYDDFSDQVLLPYKQSTMGPFMVTGDVNADGQEDVYIGGAAGQAGQLYIQSDGVFHKQMVDALHYDSGYEDMGGLLFDADGDGDNDLYVVSGGNAFPSGSAMYEDRLYLNNGEGRFTRSSGAIKVPMFKSGRMVCGLDYDHDGDIDLIVGNRIIPHKYPEPAGSYVLENTQGAFRDVTENIAPELAQFGIVNDVLSTDFNMDGRVDFIVVGEWTGIGMFQNQGGTFINVANKYGLNHQYGWWFSVTETDVNNDSLPDYVIGNAGLNTKFKASQGQPFKVFSGDFDNNGTYDVFLSNKYKGKYVPVRGKECSSQQLPMIAQKFPTYDGFANATLNDILDDKMDSSEHYEVTEFRSVLLINRKTSFTINYLPAMAQTFPILACINKDLNHDGFLDLIVAGDIYNTEVETPRWDAGNGLVLLSNHSDNYIPKMSDHTGLKIDGNCKDLALIRVESGNKEVVMATRNNSTLMTFELVDPSRSVQKGHLALK